MVAVARTAVCLSLFLLICQVSSIYVSQTVNETIQNLLRHYKIPNREKYNGTPIFPRDPPHGKREVKMVFMSGVLDTYEKLFGQMLKQLPTSTPPTADSTPGTGSGTSSGTGSGSGTGSRLQPGHSVRSNLTYMLGKVKQLKKGYFQEEEKLLHELHSLRHIQTNSSLVQAKALFELPRMLEQAGIVSHNDTMRRRRRRQTKSRTNLRG